MAVDACIRQAEADALVNADTSSIVCCLPPLPFKK